MNENTSLFENREKLAENKLIILYIMKNVNCPLSNSQILKLLYDFEGFNYYYFQHILSDLVEQNYIMYYKQEEEWLYQITRERNKRIRTNRKYPTRNNKIQTRRNNKKPS